jgi:hypothetical protein
MTFPSARLHKGKLRSLQLVLLFQHNVQRLYLHVLVMTGHCRTQRTTGVCRIAHFWRLRCDKIERSEFETSVAYIGFVVSGMPNHIGQP